MADKDMKLGIIVSATDQASSVLSNFSSKLVLTYGELYRAGMKVVDTLASFVREGMEAERVDNLLSTAMQNQGIYTEKLFESYKKFANEMQKTTIYSDEAIKGVQTRLIQYGLEGDEVNKLTQSIMDFSIAMGMDIQSTSDLFAKSIGSNVNALTRYGIEINTSADKTQKVNELIQETSRLFGGSAKANAETFAGQLAILNNKWLDMKEAIGVAIIPILKQYMSTIKILLISIEKWISDTNNLNNITSILFNSIKGIILIIGGAISAIDIYTSAWAMATAFMTGHFKAGEIGWEELKQKITEYGTLLEKIKGYKIEPPSPPEELPTVTVKEERITELKVTVSGNLYAEIDKINIAYNDMLKAVEQRYILFTNILQSGMNAFFQNVMSKNATLKGSFENLFKGMLQAGLSAITTLLAQIMAAHLIKMTLSKKESMAESMKAYAGIPFIGIALGLASALIISRIISSFATGVKNFGGGLALVGEQGPELVNLPSGSDVYTNNKSRSMLNSMSNSIIININGDIISDDETKWQNLFDEKIKKPLKTYLDKRG